MRNLQRMLASSMVLLGAAPILAQDTPIEKAASIAIGDRAPAFEAPDQDGKTWRSSDHIGKKIVVVYFYPGDFTTGCIAQAQKFRDQMNKIRDLDAEVVGISGDAPATHALFKQAFQLNFTLLADEEGRLAKQFGVPTSPGASVRAKDADKQPIIFKRSITTARWTFIIGLDGKVIYKNTKVDPLSDSKQIEAFLQKREKK